MGRTFLPFSFFVLLCFVSKCNSINIDQENNREGKVFSLFTIVNFENTECESTVQASNGQNRNGTCYTSSECGDKGGSSKGSCASGFGVCCIFVINDATTTSITQNDTYVQNPAYPTAYAETNSLSYTVSKCNDKVCYLRLDFEDFTINGPANSFETDALPTDTPPATADTAGGGKCNTDSITIKPPSSSDQNVPVICGKNTGQHIYIGMGSSTTDTASITFSFSGTSTSRKWDIKVAQIECGASNGAPPDGCLQYYTGLTGQIMTFNFQDGVNTHLSNQNYNICMRKEQGYCCIQYQVCDETTYANVFSLYRKAVDASSISQVVTECTEDYITIAGATGSCARPIPVGGNARERFCGGRFSPDTGTNAKSHAPVCDCTSPFQVGVVTDETADVPFATDLSRGVCLQFQQQPC